MPEINRYYQNNYLLTRMSSNYAQIYFFTYLNKMKYTHVKL